ncbi:MAG TPA: type II secretion system F family protein, partial [Patescibacteria group bacterium]|nr:type II secretion system F family protein [Patescibacteria group bacterium]
MGVNIMGGVGAMVVGFVIYLLLGLLPVFGVLYVIYFLVTLPLRRNERARLFLDLLQLGLDSGRTPEMAIVEAAASRDRSLGARLHLLAAYLEKGVPLAQALEKVPRLLPPQTRAMLNTGMVIGDLRKVLPACRVSLHGGVSQVRGALNYLLVLSFLATPFTVIVPLILKVKVIPAYEQIFSGMLEGAALPGLTRFVLAIGSDLIALQVLMMLAVWVLTLAYVGGPRLRAWLGRVFPGAATFIDWLFCCLPWRRKRLQRDFSAILAAVLDADVPENEAVRLAGESTANKIFSRRAQKVATQLAQGVALSEAIRLLDRSG